MFYSKLNGLLAEGGFDRWVEAHYRWGSGHPSVPTGVYFRMLLVGYFEGINSQWGISWRGNASNGLGPFPNGPRRPPC